MAKFTLEQYKALKDAYAQGAVRVKYTDKEVTYRSLDEMAKLLAQMEVDLGIKQANGFRLYAQFSKGHC